VPGSIKNPAFTGVLTKSAVALARQPCVSQASCPQWMADCRYRDGDDFSWLITYLV
jgi:hypothetical protein